MAKAKSITKKTPYKAPRLISFVERVHKGRGYCGAGSSDGEACGDGNAPGYCTNGTVHTDPYCSIGNLATTCGTGSGGGSRS